MPSTRGRGHSALGTQVTPVASTVHVPAGVGGRVWQTTHKDLASHESTVTSARNCSPPFQWKDICMSISQSPGSPLSCTDTCSSMCSEVNASTGQGASLQSPLHAQASPPFREGVIPRMTRITDISKLPGLDQALFAQPHTMKSIEKIPSRDWLQTAIYIIYIYIYVQKLNIYVNYIYTQTYVKAFGRVE